MCNHKALDKEFYDNFVNETHRNIDESNHGKKRHELRQEMEQKMSMEHQQHGKKTSGASKGLKLKIMSLLSACEMG